MKSEVLRVTHELQAMKDKIKENSEKIKVNKTLPYLVSNVIEVCVYVEGRRSQWGVETAGGGGHQGWSR
jgi:ATP-dependent 26S proteasome regulatory subunit